MKDDPGDDSVVMHVIVAWCDNLQEVLHAPFGHRPLGTIVRQADGRWEAIFALDRNKARKQRQRHFLSLDIRRDTQYPHELQRLDLQTWCITPSVHFAGQIHAFVTFVGVPEHVPWRP